MKSKKQLEAGLEVSSWPHLKYFYNSALPVCFTFIFSSILRLSIFFQAMIMPVAKIEAEKAKAAEEPAKDESAEFKAAADEVAPYLTCRPCKKFINEEVRNNSNARARISQATCGICGVKDSYSLISCKKCFEYNRKSVVCRLCRSCYRKVKCNTRIHHTSVQVSIFFTLLSNVCAVQQAVDTYKKGYPNAQG